MDYRTPPNTLPNKCSAQQHANAVRMLPRVTCKACAVAAYCLPSSLHCKIATPAVEEPRQQQQQQQQQQPASKSSVGPIQLAPLPKELPSGRRVRLEQMTHLQQLHHGQRQQYTRWCNCSARTVSAPSAAVLGGRSHPAHTIALKRVRSALARLLA